MKLGQLIECNKRNNFLEQLRTKCDVEASPRSFSQKPKLHMSLDQWSKVFYSLFLLHGKFRAIEIC